MTKVRHPEIEVKLVGTDGNAFAVISEVQRALRQSGISEDEQKEFAREATSGEKDHLLTTITRWVTLL